VLTIVMHDWAWCTARYPFQHRDHRWITSWWA